MSVSGGVDDAAVAARVRGDAGSGWHRPRLAPPRHPLVIRPQSNGHPSAPVADSSWTRSSR